MTKDFRLTPLLKKVKNIKLYELSGRTVIWHAAASARALAGNGGVGDGCTTRMGYLMPIACLIDQLRQKCAQLMRSHKL